MLGMYKFLEKEKNKINQIYNALYQKQYFF